MISLVMPHFHMAVALRLTRSLWMGLNLNSRSPRKAAPREIISISAVNTNSDCLSSALTPTGNVSVSNSTIKTNAMTICAM